MLIAILYDDDFDGKVDRREEIPGARPKIEMPTTMDSTATGTLYAPKPAPTSGTGGNPFNNQNCTNGGVAVGDRGRSGDVLDAFGLLCSVPALIF